MFAGTSVHAYMKNIEKYSLWVQVTIGCRELPFIQCVCVCVLTRQITHGLHESDSVGNHSSNFAGEHHL